MCSVCDEFGGLGCPACEEKPEKNTGFHCPHCGRDFPGESDEATPYNGDYRCRECYGYAKEEDSEFIFKIKLFHYDTN